MSPPKSRHSEPRNTHMPSFSLLIPVWVQPCSPGFGACVSWVATAVVASANGGPLGLGRRLVRRCRLGGVCPLDRFGGELGCSGRVVVTRRPVVLVVVVTVTAGLEAGLEAPPVHGDE